MSNLLSKSQIEDLLVNVLDCQKVKSWKGNKISCCCPIHNENNPSFGINSSFIPESGSEELQVFHCFSCNASGSIPRLLMLSQPDRFQSFSKAVSFLENRYGISYGKINSVRKAIKHIRRYGEEVEKEERVVLSRYSLAVYKSGKETYKYFFDRGFDECDMKEYMIGRDLQEKTVTIPVFYSDGELAGVIGRYVSKNKPHNERYHIYNFKKATLLFPSDKLEVKDDTVIIVESQFDCMMMRKWGITNVLATMGGTISKAQADIITNLCGKVILLFDNDNGGRKAEEKAKSLLKDKVRVLTCTYPSSDKGKDPCEWGKDLTFEILKSAGKVSVKRI